MIDTPFTVIGERKTQEDGTITVDGVSAANRDFRVGNFLHARFSRSDMDGSIDCIAEIIAISLKEKPAFDLRVYFPPSAAPYRRLQPVGEVPIWSS